MGQSQPSRNASYSGSVNGTLTNSPSFNNVMCSSRTYSCGIGRTVGTDFYHYTEASATRRDQTQWTNTSYCPILDFNSSNSVIRCQSLSTANENHTNDYLRSNSANYWWMKDPSVPIERFGSYSGNYTTEEFHYIQEQKTKMCIETSLSSCKDLRRNGLLSLTPVQHQRTEIHSTPLRLLNAGVFGPVRDPGNNNCDELLYSQVHRMRIYTENRLYSNTQQTRNGLSCIPEQGRIMCFEEMLSICSQYTIKELVSICELETTTGLSNLTYKKHHWVVTRLKTSKQLEGLVEPVRGNYTSDELHCIQEQLTRMCMEDWLSCCKHLRPNGLLRLTPDQHQRTEIPSTPRRMLSAGVFGTVNGSVEDISETFRKQSKHRKISVKVGSRRSEDFIPNMFQPVEQKTPVQFMRNVQRCAHMIQRREYLLLSYDHHLFVLGFDKDSINVTEYGPPSGLINIIDAALKKSLGQIHYKTITFNELFHPSASRVFLVCTGDHPNTTEEMNALLERLQYREGETSYSFIYNNCEHYVNYLLTGNPISIQWIEASTSVRLILDSVQKIPGVIIHAIVKPLLEKCLTKVQFKQILVNPSPSEEEECKRSTNGPAAQNKSGSKLRGVLKKHISSIHGRDVLFAVIYSLLMIIIFCVQGGHSPERYIWEFVRIILTETFLLLLRINRQLFDIEILLLWLQNVISTGDLFREMFKGAVVYLVCKIRVAVSFYGSNSTFNEFVTRCLVIMVSSSFAGLLFDKGHFIIDTIFRML